MQGKCLTVDTAKDYEPCYWSHKRLIRNGKVYIHSQYVWDNGYSMGIYRREYDYAPQAPQPLDDNEPF